MTERRKVPGYENYEVDSDGRVFSFQNGEWTNKKLSLGKNGYYWTTLWRDGIRRDFYAHHLVLECFVGPRPEGCEALHKDGVRTNNRRGNLRWGTRAENVADMLRHGTATIGSKNKQAKLTRFDVLILRDLRELGFTAKELARIFKVSKGTAQAVSCGQRYKTEVNHVGSANQR